MINAFLKRVIILLLLFFNCLDIFSQNLYLDWLNSLQSTNTNIITNIAVDQDRNLISGGIFLDSIVIQNQIFISKGNYDMYIKKNNTIGDLVWHAKIGGVGYDNISKILTDSTGNIYISGVFSDTVDFDPSNNVINLISHGNNDAFLLKLNNFGQFVWVKSYGGILDDSTSDIAIDNDGYIYVSGRFADTIDLNTDSLQNIFVAEGYDDTYISKFSFEGDYLWSKVIHGTGLNRIIGIIIDKNKNIICTGWATGNCDFNPDIIDSVNYITNSLLNYSFILKLTSQGDYKWHKILSGTNGTGMDLVVDLENNIYTLGYFSNKYPLSDSTYIVANNSSIDIYLNKLDSNGVFLWHKTISTSDEDFPGEICIDNNNNLYITGSHGYGEIIFDQDSISFLNSPGLLLTKYDSNGLLEWFKSYNKASGSSIDIDFSNNLYLGGSYKYNNYFCFANDTITIDYNELYEDGFSLKLSQNCLINKSFLNIEKCNNFYWDLTNLDYSETGKYFYLTQNTNNCDSIITLNLNISPLSLNEINDICLTDDSFILQNGFPNGGIYKINNIIDSIFNPSILGIGEHIISYSNFNGGCQGEVNKIVTIIDCTASIGEYNNNILIFPNPTSGKIEISGIVESELRKIELFDIQGKLIQTYQSILIDLSSYSNGFYLLKTSTKSFESINYLQLIK